MVVAEGPDGAPAETTHPDGCERAPLVETTPNPALQPLLRGHGKVQHPSVKANKSEDPMAKRPLI